jgi:hypothetical protein
MPWREKKYHCGGHSWRRGLFTKQLKKWVKAVFLLGFYGCIFHGTGNSAQLCQTFGISGGGLNTPPPSARHCFQPKLFSRDLLDDWCTPMVIKRAVFCSQQFNFIEENVSLEEVEPLCWCLNFIQEIFRILVIRFINLWRGASTAWVARPRLFTILNHGVRKYSWWTMPSGS